MANVNVFMWNDGLADKQFRNYMPPFEDIIKRVKHMMEVCSQRIVWGRLREDGSERDW